jgi:hypothetical protein
MEKTNKITTIILWVLMALSVALFAVMIVSIDDESNPGTKAVELITMNLNWSIGLFLLAAVIAVGFAVVQIVTDIEKAKRALFSLLILGVALFVSYSLASSVIPTFHNSDVLVADGILTESVSKWVGTGLHLTYVLFAGAFLSIIGFGALNLFRK